VILVLQIIGKLFKLLTIKCFISSGCAYVWNTVGCRNPLELQGTILFPLTYESVTNHQDNSLSPGYLNKIFQGYLGLFPSSFVLFPRFFELKAWIFELKAWTFVLEARSFVLKARTFMLKAWIFVLKAWTFVLKARSFVLRAWTFVLRAWTFLLEAWTFVFEARTFMLKAWNFMSEASINQLAGYFTQVIVMRWKYVSFIL